MGKTERKDYLTFISVISAFAVLTIHTNGCFWQFSATEPYWVSANIIESVCYFAVPCFFMISGITLMDFYDRYTLDEYFKRRFFKTFIPFVAWSIIGMLAQIVFGGISVRDIDFHYVYNGIVDNEFVTFFWFFTSLFIIYLSIPLYAAVEKSKRKMVFTYLVIAGVILNVLLPFIIDVFSLNLSLPYSLAVVSEALLWPPLGWLLDNSELNRGHKILIGSLAAIGLILHAGGTYLLSMQAGELVTTFKGYHNLPSVLYATGAFVALKAIGAKVMAGVIAQIFRWIGEYTFALYLIQFPTLCFVTYFTFINTKSIIYRLCAPFIIAPIIFAITYCLRKMPLIRRIVPC